MSLEAARALTLTDDHAQQIKVAKAANGQAHAIRRLLTTDKVATTSGAFLFVGQDAYTTKGGTITPDLFSQGDAGYADQPELVQELAERSWTLSRTSIARSGGMRFAPNWTGHTTFT